MKQGDPYSGLMNRLRVLGTQIACTLMDMVFLSAWVFIQWATDSYVIDKLELYGIQRWLLSTFQFLFAVSTLAPVAIYIYQDIRLMVLKSKRIIQQQIDLVRTNGTEHEQK